MPELLAAFEVPSQALVNWSDDDRCVMTLSLMHIKPLEVLMLLISTLSGLEPSMLSTGDSDAKPSLSILSNLEWNLKPVGGNTPGLSPAP
jgi:hypothetical protein